MAKAQTQSYLVTDKSDITYSGKTAPMGSVVSDLPGESISWLLADGYIIPSDAPFEAPAQSDASAPSEEVAN
jgi:hypothetical protein